MTVNRRPPLIVGDSYSNQVAQGMSFDVTAYVNSLDSPVSSVVIRLDADHNGSVSVGDPTVAIATFSVDHWTATILTGTLPLGANRFFITATDSGTPPLATTVVS